MQTIRLIHWKAEEAEERAARLAALGYHVDCRPPTGRGFLRELAQNPPDAVLIDLARLPSQGRDLAIQIRRQAATRQVPLIFAGGQEAKVDAIRELLPDAMYAQWPDLGDALAHLPRELVVAVILFEAGRAEDGHAGPDPAQAAEAPQKLAEYPQRAFVFEALADLGVFEETLLPVATCSVRPAAASSRVRPGGP